MNEPENPPAFPQGHLDGPSVNPEGMSLRDYFAAKAMQGIIASTDPSICSHDAEAPRPCKTWKDFAIAAYQQADEMLKARQP